MVQTALDDQDILAAIRKGKLAAIADDTFCRPSILGDQPGRKVHTFEPGEAETLESDQTVAAAAEELYDFGFAGPFCGAQSIETGDKFLDFFFWRFKSQIGGFPWIGS